MVWPYDQSQGHIPHSRGLGLGMSTTTGTSENLNEEQQAQNAHFQQLQLQSEFVLRHRIHQQQQQQQQRAIHGNMHGTAMPETGSCDYEYTNTNANVHAHHHEQQEQQFVHTARISMATRQALEEVPNSLPLSSMPNALYSNNAAAAVSRAQLVATMGSNTINSPGRNTMVTSSVTGGGYAPTATDALLEELRGKVRQEIIDKMREELRQGICEGRATRLQTYGDMKLSTAQMNYDCSGNGNTHEQERGSNESSFCLPLSIPVPPPLPVKQNNTVKKRPKPKRKNQKEGSLVLSPSNIDSDTAALTKNKSAEAKQLRDDASRTGKSKPKASSKQKKKHMSVVALNNASSEKSVAPPSLKDDEERERRVQQIWEQSTSSLTAKSRCESDFKQRVQLLSDAPPSLETSEEENDESEKQEIINTIIPKDRLVNANAALPKTTSGRDANNKLSNSGKWGRRSRSQRTKSANNIAPASSKMIQEQKDKSEKKIDVIVTKVYVEGEKMNAVLTKAQSSPTTAAAYPNPNASEGIKRKRSNDVKKKLKVRRTEQVNYAPPPSKVNDKEYESPATDNKKQPPATTNTVAHKRSVISGGKKRSRNAVKKVKQSPAKAIDVVLKAICASPSVTAERGGVLNGTTPLPNIGEEEQLHSDAVEVLDKSDQYPATGCTSKNATRGSRSRHKTPEGTKEKRGVKLEDEKYEKCCKCLTRLARKGCSEFACVLCCSDVDCEGHKEKREKAALDEDILNGTTDIQKQAAKRRASTLLRGSFREKAFEHHSETVNVWNFSAYMSEPKWRDDAIRKSLKRQQHRSSSLLPTVDVSSKRKPKEKSRQRFKRVMDELYHRSLASP